MNALLTDPLSAAFSALADPTRRAILARLALGDTRVGDLVKPFAISGPAISRHLRVLENARLIERKVDAQWRICSLNPPGLRVANDWLAQYSQFWDDSLNRLAEVLERESGLASPARRRSTTPSTTTRRQRAARVRNITSRAPTSRKRKSP